ncbi:hypothetical protein AC1031_009284 [Aphanomyces cochlioides]|nr:hypothetical protein AC1031_009284 [Aphanomyces cochlioides]
MAKGDRRRPYTVDPMMASAASSRDTDIHRHVKVVVDNPTSLVHVAVNADPAAKMSISLTSPLQKILKGNRTPSPPPPLCRVHIANGEDGPGENSSGTHPPKLQSPPPPSPSHERFKRSLSFVAATTRSYDPNVLRRTLQEMQEGARYSYVLHPLSMAKTLWDLSTAMWVLVYCWLVPTQVCFESWVPEDDTHDLMLFFDVWFILDMVLRFRTGIVECGVVILNPKVISARYTRSAWFYVDLFSSFPIEIFFPSAIDSATSATTRHSVKMVKYLKLPKLLRLGRLLTNVRRYKGYTGILTAMGSLFFLTHIAACIWVVLVNPCDEHTSAFEPLCDSSGFSDLYAMAFVVALGTLLGVANAPIDSSATILGGAHKTGTAPRSLYIWSAIVQPMGTVYLALIFGNVITIVHSFNRIGNAFRKKMDHIYYEMESLNLPKSIQSRVLAYYDYLWVNNRNLCDTMMLLRDQSMSEPLRHQIAIYLYKDQLVKVPFFQHASDDILGMICMLLRQVVYMPNDFIFKEGEIGRELYMIAKGCVEVLPSEQPGTHSDKPILLADGDFFGEIGIVMEVFRTRSVRTKTMTELCILTRDGFNSILGDFPEFANEMKKLVVTRVSMLYGNRNLPPDTLDKIKQIAEKNMQRRIKAYGEIVQHSRRRPQSTMFMGRRGQKFDLSKRLDMMPPNSSSTSTTTTTTTTTDESKDTNEASEATYHANSSDSDDEDDEIDEKLLSAKVWKLVREMKRLKATTTARHDQLNATMEKMLATLTTLQAQVAPQAVERLGNN